MDKAASEEMENQVHDERLLEVLPFVSSGGSGTGTFYLQVRLKQSQKVIDPTNVAPPGEGSERIAGEQSGFWVLPKRSLPSILQTRTLDSALGIPWPMDSRTSS